MVDENVLLCKVLVRLQAETTGMSATNRWLEIPVSETIVVHIHKAFGKLRDNILGLLLGEGLVEMLLQITVLKVFHRDEHH